MRLNSPDSVFEVGTLTREEFHRLRDGPKTNGDKPTGPACEICGKPLAGRQKRYCGNRCAAAGAREANRKPGRRRQGQDAAAVWVLLAQLLGVGGVSEVQVVFRGVVLKAKEA